ncbi:Uncharacterised protein [Klebsiella pneumoniae]|nr:Uncharacterised protein [Klebsiella pneumoniae]
MGAHRRQIIEVLPAKSDAALLADSLQQRDSKTTLFTLIVNKGHRFVGISDKYRHYRMLLHPGTLLRAEGDGAIDTERHCQPPGLCHAGEGAGRQRATHLVDGADQRRECWTSGKYQALIVQQRAFFTGQAILINARIDFAGGNVIAPHHHVFIIGDGGHCRVVIVPGHQPGLRVSPL